MLAARLWQAVAGCAPAALAGPWLELARENNRKLCELLGAGGAADVCEAALGRPDAGGVLRALAGERALFIAACEAQSIASLGEGAKAEPAPPRRPETPRASLPGVPIEYGPPLYEEPC